MPGTLFVKQYLFDLITQGKKTSTLRLKTGIKMNDEFVFLCGKRNVRAKATNVSKVYLPTISDELIKREGFETRDELIKVLTAFYPAHTNEFVLIEFEVINHGRNNKPQLTGNPLT